MNKIKKILIITSDKGLKEVLGFCFDGWGYEVVIWDVYQDINSIKKISPDVIVVDIHSAQAADLTVCNLIKDDFMTAFIPTITLIDKRHLRKQLLNLKHGIEDYLIKPPDPLDLRIRIEMAIRRSQYSFHASPLTGLPGMRVIEEEVKERLKNKKDFTYCYVDIDNFKYFNDVHGVVKGDEAIMQTAYILYNTIKKFGNPDDFIGHIGGDDFVFITTSKKYEKVSQEFIHMFDELMPYHYSKEDRVRKHIVARDRNHEIRKMPLMSVSIAVVDKESTSSVNSVIKINERVAEIKKYLKGIEGSIFMVDRRDYGKKKISQPHIHKAGIAQNYSPLGQILVDKGFLSKEQLGEALKVHWRRGVILGDILKELGLLKEDQLSQALAYQETMPSNLKI